ncbi:MAG TPA: adenylyltransferase/sulfurtransferase MoeZ [Actinomycetes bacterium]|jgi:adenylyltransferase/sulfurtransferase|nr:adenylyltransferase/sulfurtransferase MoeZ [Actinomycetes bacterium]
MALPALVEPAGELSRDEIFRYSRHLIIPDVAMDGQKRLKNASVLLIGAGGLGSPNAMYLAAAGVGHIGMVDFDEVDASNLQRQIIHGTSDVGRPKLESARDKIREINPYVEVTLHETRLTSDNAREIIRAYDLVVDGSDNFPTRYLVNDACVLERKPYVWGSIYRFDGQASVFWAEHGPCYRCLYPEPPPPGMVPSCAEGGVLGVLCATVGSVQANEAVKLIAGIGDPLVGRLLIYDALELSFKDIRVRKDPECPVCGKDPSVTELIDYEEFCGMVSDQAQAAAAGSTLTPGELKELLDGGQRIALIDVREPAEWQINRIPSAKLIPLGELPSRLTELPQTERVVVYCKTGVRSAEALALLKQSGFSTAKHLGGGIAAYVKTVDPSMPRY